MKANIYISNVIFILTQIKCFIYYTNNKTFIHYLFICLFYYDLKHEGFVIIAVYPTNYIKVFALSQDRNQSWWEGE